MIEYLTQSDVSELPDGTPIIVWWSGGNGPWRYTISYDKWRTAWFRTWKGKSLLQDHVMSPLCGGLKAVRLPEFYQMVSPFCNTCEEQQP